MRGTLVGNLLLRLLIAVAIILASVDFFAPDANHTTSLTYDYDQSSKRTPHVNRYLLHQAGLNAETGYLTDARGYSVTRSSADDIGFFVWQANLKLFRDLVSPGSSMLSYPDLIGIRLAFVGLTLGLIFLLRNDAPAALMATIAMASSRHWSRIEDTVIWPDVLCIVISVVLLYWLCQSITRERAAANDYLSLLVLATLGGIVGSFRASGAFLLGVSFLVLLVALLLALLISHRRESAARDRPGERESGWIRRPAAWVPAAVAFLRRVREAARPPGLVRAVILAGLVVVGVNVVAPAAQFLNVALYAAIDDKSHWPATGGRHVKWGPLWAGLGVPNYNSTSGSPHWSGENVFWNDSAVRLMTSKENGTFGGWDANTEAAARASYFRILWHNTPFVADLYFQRFRIAIEDIRTIVAFAAAAVVAVGLMALQGKGLRRVAGVTWLLGSGTLALLGFLPMVGNPGINTPFRLAVTAVGIFSLAHAFKMASYGQALPAPATALLQAVRWLLLAGVFLVLLLMGRVVAVESHREDLVTELRAGALSLDQLFDEYHRDATYAFNHLDAAQRREIADRVKGTDAELRQGTIEVRSDDVVFVAYEGDYLFALVSVEERITDGKVFPVEIDFKQENYNMTTDVMALPKRIEPGIWLFSFRLPREHVNGAVIKPATQFTSNIYTTPAEEEK